MSIYFNTGLTSRHKEESALIIEQYLMFQVATFVYQKPRKIPASNTPRLAQQHMIISKQKRAVSCIKIGTRLQFNNQWWLSIKIIDTWMCQKHFCAQALFFVKFQKFKLKLNQYCIVYLAQNLRKSLLIKALSTFILC